MKPIRFLSLSALLATPALAADDDLLKMVDADTDIVFHISDTAKTAAHWNKSPLKKVYDSEEIKPRVEEMIEEFMAFEDLDNEEASKALKKGIETLYDQIQGEFLFAMNIPALDKAGMEKLTDGDSEGETAKAVMSSFGGLVLGELKVDGADFTSNMKKMIETAIKDSGDEPKLTLKTQKIDGVDFTTLNGADEEVSIDMLSFAAIGKTGVVTFGAYDLEDLVSEVKDGHSKPLSKSELIPENAGDFQFFMDFSDGMTCLKTLADIGLTETGMMAQAQINLDAGWKAIGLSGLDRLVYTVDMSKKDIVFNWMSDDVEGGLLDALVAENPIKKRSIHAHNGVVSLIQSNYDLAEIYDAIMKIIKDGSPLGPMIVGMQIGQFEQMIGVKIREDLLSSFAPEFEYVEFKGAENAYEQLNTLAFIFGLKDQAKLEGAIKTMVSASEMEMEKEDFLGYTIHHLDLGENKISHSFFDNKVVFGVGDGSAVKNVLKQVKNPQDPMWETVTTNHRGLLKPDPLLLAYSDLQESFSPIFDMLGEIADEDFPDFSKIEIPFSYQISAAWQAGDILFGKDVLIAE